ncbi:hypothetical protein CO662_20680 [Rhizobium anhuiense]|uniref:Uncharacterized protein n=1 Tax=Rhizobium anhuiense TaxID=1184720 RepID=A0ABX4J404_9HYPH|nr:hypothetical protein [Rhizobium anhuiense]PDS43177.1 hypothetical protein CO668_18895 [Rhizobium anhuiense]PDS49918.1 hypothetical protein CO662_20680 [Rhizobium anhuiense]
MWPKDALRKISDPSTSEADYALAVRTLTRELLVRAKQKKFFPLVGIHVVSTVADFDLMLAPAAEELEWDKHKTALTCLWPDYQVVLDGVIDVAPIKLAMSQTSSASMRQLLFVCQSIGTITELESMAAHVLFEPNEQEYETIAVLTPVAHIEAEEQFKMALPQKYRERLKWIELRRDPKLTTSGVLLPGVAMSNAERAGFRSFEETSSYVPDIFRSRYNFEKRPKPTSGLSMI